MNKWNPFSADPKQGFPSMKHIIGHNWSHWPPLYEVPNRHSITLNTPQNMGKVHFLSIKSRWMMASSDRRGGVDILKCKHDVYAPPISLVRSTTYWNMNMWGDLCVYLGCDHYHWVFGDVIIPGRGVWDRRPGSWSRGYFCAITTYFHKLFRHGRIQSGCM